MALVSLRKPSLQMQGNPPNKPSPPQWSNPVTESPLCFWWNASHSDPIPAPTKKMWLLRSFFPTKLKLVTKRAAGRSNHMIHIGSLTKNQNTLPKHQFSGAIHASFRKCRKTRNINKHLCVLHPEFFHSSWQFNQFIYILSCSLLIEPAEKGTAPFREFFGFDETSAAS